MTPRPNPRRWLYWLTALLAPLAGCSRGDSAPPPATEAAVPVVVAKVVAKTVPEQLQAVGNVQAYATVAIKARVDGELTQAHFKEGQSVREGQLLFTLDPRPWQAQVDQAEAALARDQALLQRAQTEEARYAGLRDKNFVSKEEYNRVRTELASAQAVVRADEAAARSARLQLSYATIYSPIDGVAGRILIQRGNLVKANDVNPLVIINQVSPIYVEFAVAERYLPAIRKNMANRPLPVTATAQGEDQAAAVGALSFIDNSVDPATGAIKLKATFANAERRLWPGQFVRVQLLLAEQENALTAPSQAVQTGPEGDYVFVVDAAMKARQRPVAVARVVGQESVIEQGLAPGEQVVIDGQNRLTDGAWVQPRQNLADRAP